jgi:PKD repeat protein
MRKSFAQRVVYPFRVSVRSCVLVSLIAAVIVSGRAASPGAEAQESVVNVSTVAQLQSAVAGLTSGVTIRIAPGRYPLTQELRIRNGVRNVAIVGASGNRDDVVIVGSGMTTAGVNIALKVENAQDIRIADLSIGEAYWHPIQLQGELGAERVHVSNVRLFDAGQQFLKSTVNPLAPNGVDDVIVEDSVIEYTTIGPPHGYTEGIDVHHGANWIIRRNLFRNIHVPAGAPDTRRPAILMWSGSRNTVVDSNTFINCERAIIFGLGPKAPYQFSHSGGLIVNNFIYRSEPVNADAGISIWDSPGTRVHHNTVIQNGTYPAAIEYRFPSTTGVEIINNVTDGLILRRDNATALVENNYTQASPSLFVDAPRGDLHLVASAVALIDQAKPLAAVTTDRDGQARPVGVAPDIGADERTTSSSPGRAPVATFTATPTTGDAPLTVQFDGRGSTDPDGGALTFSWSFGTGLTGGGSTTSHTYAQAGTFDVRLTVTDPQGLTATSTQSIVVRAATALVAPADLRGTVSNRTVALTWSDRSTGETEYFVERASDRRGYVLIGRLPADAASFTDPVVPRGWVRYRVRAFSSVTKQFSPYSNGVSVRVK